MEEINNTLDKSLHSFFGLKLTLEDKKKRSDFCNKICKNNKK